jgi:hypothetical protein
MLLSQAFSRIVFHLVYAARESSIPAIALVRASARQLLGETVAGIGEERWSFERASVHCATGSGDATTVSPPRTARSAVQ